MSVMNPMNCQNLPGIPNPIHVCQKIYGIDNYNEVRDATVNSVRRFYQILNNISPYNQVDLYVLLQEYMVQIIVNAGRNPKSFKLAIPPQRLQKNIFPYFYLHSNFNKEEAFKKSIEEAYQFPPGEREVQLKNILIDYHSIF